MILPPLISRNKKYKQILEVCSQRIQDLVGSAVGNYQKSFNYYAYNESKLPVLSYERNVFIILFEKASFLRLSPASFISVFLALLNQLKHSQFSCQCFNSTLPRILSQRVNTCDFSGPPEIFLEVLTFSRGSRETLNNS